MRVAGTCAARVHDDIAQVTTQHTEPRQVTTETRHNGNVKGCLRDLNGQCPDYIEYGTKEVKETVNVSEQVTMHTLELVVQGRAVVAVGGQSFEVPIDLAQRGPRSDRAPDFRALGIAMKDAITRQVLEAIAARTRAELAIACRAFGGPCNGEPEAVPGFSDEELRELQVIP